MSKMVISLIAPVKIASGPGHENGAVLSGTTGAAKRQR